MYADLSLIEIITVSRSDWKKASTYSDDASSGAITAMALSVNGVYLATASKSGLCIWSTQNRRMLYKLVDFRFMCRLKLYLISFIHSRSDTRVH